MLEKAAALLLASSFVYQPVSAVIPADTAAGITLTDERGQSLKAENGKFTLSFSEPGTYHYTMKGNGKTYQITSRVYTDGLSLEHPVLTISKNGRKVNQAVFAGSDEDQKKKSGGNTKAKSKNSKKNNQSASVRVRVPKTGDESQLTVYTAILAEALLIASAAKRRLKKAKESDRK